MKLNMGGVDRIVRIIIAIVIGVLYFTNTISGPVAIILGVIAAIFLITGIVGVCPAYMVLGICTCKKDQKAESASAEQQPAPQQPAPQQTAEEPQPTQPQQPAEGESSEENQQ